MGHYGWDFERVRRQLVQEFPTGCPVRVLVRTEKQIEKVMPDAVAFAEHWAFEDGTLARHRIYIPKGYYCDTAIGILLHEWAHCLDVENNGLTDRMHRISWAVIYSKIYERIIHGN
jgi:hypothetical protein